jgi:hypothetical protein
MEKYYFINHIVFGKTYFYLLAAASALIFLIFIWLIFRYKNDFQIIKKHFLTAVLGLWLVFTLALVFTEIKWLIADYSGLAHKSQMEKAGYFYDKFTGDKALMPYLKFVKNQIEPDSTVFFISPSGFEYTFAKYYLYPEIKITNGRGVPDYILLYNADPKTLNASLPMEIYKSFSPDKNILKIKL